MSEVQFVNEGHLGGYVRSTPEYPHGDPWTWCPEVWDWAIETFKPQTVVDVGCGEGHTVKYFRERGILQAHGVDGSPTAQRESVIGILPHDFNLGPLTFAQVDLIWSCEFVEHVEEKYIDNFLPLFSSADKAVLMTHAFPSQGGWHHVNCQPTEYWITHMARWGHRLDWELTKVARALSSWTHWGRSGLVFLPAMTSEERWRLIDRRRKEAFRK
jgi:hypothetical protein